MPLRVAANAQSSALILLAEAARATSDELHPPLCRRAEAGRALRPARRTAASDASKIAPDIDARQACSVRRVDE